MGASASFRPVTPPRAVAWNCPPHRDWSASESWGRLPLLAPYHRPALELGNRAMLFDPDDVTDLEFVLLVVRVVFLRMTHCLFEQRMRVSALDAHHQRLVLFIAHHDALERSLRHI